MRHLSVELVNEGRLSFVSVNGLLQLPMSTPHISCITTSSNMVGYHRDLTASFNNMRILKFKAQPTNTSYATVNQMFGGSPQFLPDYGACAVLNDLI